jgi:hypothetical protein
MYQEEYYEDEYAESVDASTLDNTTISSTNTRVKKNKEVLKYVDNGKYKVTGVLNGEPIKFECYATNATNHAYIRNAVTGIIQSHRACSGQEDLYFKVIDVSGLGNPTKWQKHLYYDSPEECERHQNRKVSIQTKKKWYEKYLKAKMKYES